MNASEGDPGGQLDRLSPLQVPDGVALRLDLSLRHQSSFLETEILIKKVIFNNFLQQNVVKT
jgi:hypothetical protein